MFCPHCGYENATGAVACKRCGNALPVTSATAAATRVQPRAGRTGAEVSIPRGANARAYGQQSTRRTVAPDATTVMPVSVHDAARAKPGTGVPQGATSYNAVPLKTRRTRWWVVAIFFLLAAAVVAFAATQVLQFMEDAQTAAAQQAVYDEAHQIGTVDLTFYIDGYLEGSSSPIPIRIEGTDIDGNHIDQLQLMNMVNHKVDLPRGTYTFTPAGDPVSAGGVLFAAPIPATIGVDAEGVTVDGVRKPGPEFLYTPVAAADITDAQVAAVRTWMVDAGMDIAAVQKYLDAMANARAAAGAEQASAAAAAALGEATHVETGAFTFTLPASWADAVDVVKTTDEDGDPVATVTMKGTGQSLLEVSIVPASWELVEGDVEYHLAAHVENERTRVEMWSHNWAYVAAAGNSGLNEDTLNTLVRLSTGGELNYNSAVAAGEAVGTPDITYITSQHDFDLAVK